MAQNIYHLESKRVENLVFSSKMGGENGIFSQKCRSGDFGIFQKSPIQVEKMVKNRGGENGIILPGGENGISHLIVVINTFRPQHPSHRYKPSLPQFIPVSPLYYSQYYTIEPDMPKTPYFMLYNCLNFKSHFEKCFLEAERKSTEFWKF